MAKVRAQNGSSGGGGHAVGIFFHNGSEGACVYCIDEDGNMDATKLPYQNSSITVNNDYFGIATGTNYPLTVKKPCEVYGKAYSGSMMSAVATYVTHWDANHTLSDLFHTYYQLIMIFD